MNVRCGHSQFARRLLLPIAVSSTLLIQMLTVFGSGSAAEATAAGCLAQPVAWTRYEPNVTVTGTGNSIEKTSGSNGWGDAGAVSTKSIVSGDGYVAASVDSRNYHVIFGLGEGDTNQDYTDPEYGIYLQGQVDGLPGDLMIYEGGAKIQDFGPAYVAGDIFRVAVEGGQVKYYKNGALLYINTRSFTYPLLMDTALYHVNAEATNASIQGCNLGDTASS